MGMNWTHLNRKNKREIYKMDSVASQTNTLIYCTRGVKKRQIANRKRNKSNEILYKKKRQWNSTITTVHERKRKHKH